MIVPSPARRGLLLVLVVFGLAGPARADEPAKADSPLVKLLKGGRVPPERQPLVIDQIGRRGTADDLAYLYRQTAAPDGFAPAVRIKALDALAEAARTRKIAPKVDLAGLQRLISSPGDPATRLAAIRLAGLWKAEGAGEALRKLATADQTDEATRAEALDALVAISGDAARPAIEALTSADRPAGVRGLAVAALAKLDPKAAADQVLNLLREPPTGLDPTPMIAALLNRQGGADLLADTLRTGGKLPADSAKLALRAVYGLGRSDPALIAELTRAAGLDAEVKPLDAPALRQLIADVAAQGDPARGEQVFRRADLNCTKCHAVAGAGGGIGPDLSPIGSTSPVDYIINSIMLPDQAIKEQFHTLVVLTSEGQVYQGIVADRDDQRIVLKDANGETRAIPVADIEDQKEGGSLMPAGLVNLMTRDEFVDLVRFLSELGKPGPYAIRAQPTIQRWRVFRDVPDSLRQSIPETIQVHTELLNADPSHWVPYYALVSGDLPLEEPRSIAAGPVVYLLGEIELSAAGRLALRLDSAEGVALWLNSRPVAFEGDRAAIDAAEGLQRLVFRVDTAARKAQTLRVEVSKPPGSEAQFTVIGGR
jgi:putative heme-binding domain-containing protein